MILFVVRSADDCDAALTVLLIFVVLVGAGIIIKLCTICTNENLCIIFGVAAFVSNANYLFHVSLPQ